MTIYLDFETRSEIDVSVVGAYKYWRHPSTEILCLFYAIDDNPIKAWIPGFTAIENRMPFDMQAHLAPGINGKLEAHNANFEINGWNEKLVKEYSWPEIPLSRWRCSAVKAAMYGLPRKLEKVAAALKLTNQKDMEGHRVMLQLTKPRNPSKNNPDSFFSDEKRFEKVFDYCAQDVRTERELSKYLKPINENEWFYWYLDQKINNRGIPIDVKGVKAARLLTKQLEQKAKKRIQKLTNKAVNSPTEIARIKKWSKRQGVKIDTLAADKIPALLADKSIPKKVRKVIALRDQNNKSSTSKLNALLNRVNEDNRIRDTLLFYGAHTGRWTGLGFQPQNIPKGKLKHDQVVQAIKLIKKGNLEGLQEFGEPLDVISSCLRGFICAPKGKELICADYASIEARLVLWLAGEYEAVQQLKEGRDIYKELASDIYRKLVKKINREERDNGKRGILGGGYGMGAKKMRETAAKYGANISEKLAQKIIDAYRTKYAKVPLLWKQIEKAAIDCVFHKRRTAVKGVDQDIVFTKKGRFLFCKLPSNRLLTYYKPRLSYGKFDKLQLSYMGLSTATHQFVKKYTWGGKLVENVIQSLARDIMAFGMMQAEQSKKYKVILTVHDEVLAECDKGSGNRREFISLLTRVEPWAKTCPIQISLNDCWIGKRYRK